VALGQWLSEAGKFDFIKQVDIPQSSTVTVKEIEKLTF